MAKLIGNKKVRTAVFISGRGSNLKNLIKFSKTKNSPIEINLVISDKEAAGLKYALQNKIKKKIIYFKNYDKLINSKNADMQNINYVGGAGSTTAAQFLQRFVLNKTPWAHLDIAGMAFSKYGGALNSGGATPSKAFIPNFVNFFLSYTFTFKPIFFSAFNLFAYSSGCKIFPGSETKSLA